MLAPQLPHRGTFSPLEWIREETDLTPSLPCREGNWGSGLGRVSAPGRVSTKCLALHPACPEHGFRSGWDVPVGATGFGADCAVADKQSANYADTVLLCIVLSSHGAGGRTLPCALPWFYGNVSVLRYWLSHSCLLHVWPFALEMISKFSLWQTFWDECLQVPHRSEYCSVIDAQGWSFHERFSHFFFAKLPVRLNTLMLL